MLIHPKIEAIWVKNYSVYGRRKLAKAVRNAGLDIRRDQVARLMRARNPRSELREEAVPTHADPAAVCAPNLVKRLGFSAYDRAMVDKEPLEPDPFDKPPRLPHAG